MSPNPLPGTLVVGADSLEMRSWGMPEPRDGHIRDRMRSQKTSGTKPETAVRSLLHGMGLRYRVDYRPEPDVRTRPDIVFTRRRVAIYVDGCFWHGCPDHFIPPKNNEEWWAAKIWSNKSRDAKHRAALRDRGWTVAAYWEHESPQAIAEAVRIMVASVEPR